MVVAAGRAGLTEMFPRLPERSPYLEPQRRLFAGLFRGIRHPRPFAMTFNIIPGQGRSSKTSTSRSTASRPGC